MSDLAPFKAEAEHLRIHWWSPPVNHGSLFEVEFFGIRMYVYRIDRFMLITEKPMACILFIFILIKW
jgi:hypothetical protein